MSSKKERRKAKRRNDKLRDEAWAAVECGKLEFGLRLIGRAVERGPANARSWHEQGLIFKLCGKLVSAEQSLAEAVELSPNYAAALRELAALVAERGARRQALELLKRLIVVEPEDRAARAQIERWDGPSPIRMAANAPVDAPPPMPPATPVPDGLRS